MAFVYSCCFWFSLRLGGILIGIFAIIQAVICLTFVCIAFKQSQNVKDQISLWTTNINLLYIQGQVDNFQAEPEKYMTYGIVIIIIYISVCILYIYGAYACNNIAMAGYILLELVRLISLSVTVTIWLLVLKHNTMDIGLVIGASVASGFVLLGMFYLWVCAANLPILITEMELDERTATIEKLQRMLENKEQRFKSRLINSPLENYNERRQLFAITTNSFPNVGTRKSNELQSYK